MISLIQKLVFYLMCVWEHEKQQFLHNIFGINRKEMLQLVHRHKSVNLWDDKLGEKLNKLHNRYWYLTFIRSQMQCTIDIYRWVNSVHVIVKHGISPLCSQYPCLDWQVMSHTPWQHWPLDQQRGCPLQVLDLLPIHPPYYILNYSSSGCS